MTDKGIEHITEMFTKFGIMIFNLILLGGTAYLVQEYNWSMWTFLLAMCFFLIPRKKDGQKDSNEDKVAT